MRFQKNQETDYQLLKTISIYMKNIKNVRCSLEQELTQINGLVTKRIK